MVCTTRTDKSKNSPCNTRSCLGCIELIANPEIYSIFLNGIQGGLVDTNMKSAQANHPNLDNYDAKKWTKQLYALDLVQSYPSAIYGFTAPQGHYKQWTPEQTSKMESEIINYNIFHSWSDQFCFKKRTNGHELEYGIYLLADMSIPDRLHDYFSGCPPFLQKRTVQYAEYSPVQRRKIDQLGIKVGNTQRFVPTVGPATNVLLDWRLFKLYMQLGVTLDSLKTVIEFRVSYYARGFFEKVAKLR